MWEFNLARSLSNKRVYKCVKGDNKSAEGVTLMGDTKYQALLELDKHTLSGGFYCLFDMNSEDDEPVAWADVADGDTDVFWEFPEDYRFEDD